ncbi:MAG: hypothetical protein AAF502_20350 [Bacteroidota bacterium]
MIRKVYFLLILSLVFFNANAQNIGIGTSAPDYSLDINGNLGINDFIYHNDDGSDTWIGFPTDNSIEIVVGNQRLILSNDATKELRFNPDNNDYNVIIVADGIEHLFNADTEDGRIGIGTAEPQYLLDVNGSMSVADYIFHRDDSDSYFGFLGDNVLDFRLNSYRILRLEGNTNAAIINPDATQADFIIVADGIEHLFYANTTDKYVGIGTSEPEHLLDVNGNFRVIGDQIEHLIYADAILGRVGIGTDMPSMALEVVGGAKVDELIVGSSVGTAFKGLQSGETVVTTNSLTGESVLTSISFPNGGFDNTPTLIATAVNLNGPNGLTFAVTVTSITSTGAVLNIDKVTNDQGWTDDIKINWLAWE